MAEQLLDRDLQEKLVRELCSKFEYALKDTGGNTLGDLVRKALLSTWGDSLIAQAVKEAVKASIHMEGKTNV